MNPGAQAAAAFAMDNPHRQDAQTLAFPEPGRQQFREIPGAVGVQIEVTADLDPDRLPGVR
jgi:hypothetical protein